MMKKITTLRNKKSYKQGKCENNFHKHNKSLYSKEDSNSFEESNKSVSNGDREETLLMAIEAEIDALEDEDKAKEKMDSKEGGIVVVNGKVDLKELMCAFRKIKKLKKINL